MIEFINNQYLTIVSITLLLFGIILFIKNNCGNWGKRKKSISNEMEINKNGLYVQDFHKLHDIHLFLIENNNIFMEYVGSKEEISLTNIAKKYLNPEIYKDWYSVDVFLLNMIKHFPYYLIYVKI